MKIRRFLSIFLLAVLLATLTVPAYGLEDPAIRAKAALLVDISSDTVLYEKDIHDELESIYIKAMDFDKTEEIRKELTERIWSSEWWPEETEE